MTRVLVRRGRYHLISCAVDASGRSPAAEYLKALKEERDQSEPPYKGRAHAFDRLLDLIRELATQGTLESRGSYNYLGNGIWELKADTARITFYDTDGKGAWMPNDGEVIDSWDGKRKHLIPTDFGPHIRLGHAFDKDSKKTKQEDLGLADKIRKEDIDHDK